MKPDDPAVLLTVATLAGAVVLALPIAATAGIAIFVHRRRQEHP